MRTPSFCAGLLARVLAAALLTAGAVTAARAQAPQNFAYRAELITAQPDGLHAFELNETAYRAASYADLRDLRVFNAAGEALPLAQLPPRPQPVTQDGPAGDLALVPLPARERARVLQDFALRMEKDGARAVIEIKSAAPALTAAGLGADAQPEAGGYLLDLRPHKGSDGTLTLRFAADAPDYAAPVRILGSEDFVNWRAMAGGPLARNRKLGDTVERGAFALKQAPSFAQIVWEQGPAPRLASARYVEQVAAALSLPRTALKVTRGKDRAGTYYVDVPVGLPVARIRIRTDRPNLSARVRVYRHDDGDRPAHLRIGLHAGLRARRAPERWLPEGGVRDVFYVNRDGQWLEAAPFALSGPATQLRIDALDGTGFGDALPIVEAEYRPARYAFAARGPAPYVLAIGLEAGGSADSGPGPRLEASAVLAADDKTGERLALARFADNAASAAVPGAPSHGERSAQAASWSRYLLWCVLTLAVIALALMAWSIAKQLRRAPGQAAPPDVPPVASPGAPPVEPPVELSGAPPPP